jgi:hypothetical protein
MDHRVGCRSPGYRWASLNQPDKAELSWATVTPNSNELAAGLAAAVYVVWIAAVDGLSLYARDIVVHSLNGGGS